MHTFVVSNQTYCPQCLFFGDTLDLHRKSAKFHQLINKTKFSEFIFPCIHVTCKHGNIDQNYGTDWYSITINVNRLSMVNVCE